MREILFRGKTYNDKWVQGLLVQMDDHLTQIRKLGSDGIGYYDYSIVPSTVGQYTGLTDKNGKKIFEGDIVDITQYDNVYHKVHRCCKSKVFFSNFAFRTNAAPDYEDEEPLSYWFWHDCDFEVIGNIYDNPELLEVKK